MSFLRTINILQKLQSVSDTVGPRYSRSFYLRFRLFAVQKLPFFEEPILQFQPYIGLFIREFVIRGPIFQERIYLEQRGKPVLVRLKDVFLPCDCRVFIITL